MTESIDPTDWDTAHHVTSDQIVARVLEGAREGGNVVLLHDGGGNRDATVAALPVIIDRLHKQSPNARYELEWETPLDR